MLDLIDIGANLTHDSFDADRDAVLARAAAAGVRAHHRDGHVGHEQRASGGALRGAARRACSRRPACIRITRPSSTRTRRPRCARCSATRRSSPSANAASISFATTRRATRSGTHSRHSSSSLPTCGKPVFLHQRDAHDEFVALLAPVRAAPRRRRRALLHGRPEGARGLSRARPPRRRHGLGLRRAPRCRAARGRAADPARSAADRDRRAVPACRAISRPKPQRRRNEPHSSRMCSSASRR